MDKKPPIIVTDRDLQRLERLLERLEDDEPGVAALQSELDRADVVTPDKIPAGIVTMNSRVHCREESSGKDYRLTLVYPHQVGAEGLVSILAPVGSALLGLSVGQEIDWPTSTGKVLKLILLDVEYQPEEAEDWDL
ncbi:MAG: nucleoside diphosphate kinase regulator [Kaiparowitsia implicata GSE-PSE-MK54-09C]|jgi:regulator of nucleoside diphosphate kinase|nr:nucleoside diphosphate kinase regulator [Kaiparowitsia implicata GSE-PSE-MK54-09C]